MQIRARSGRLLTVAGLALVVLAIGVLPAGAMPSTSLVISQVYGGGGNSGATLTNDFIEIFNLGTDPVSLSGWSVQYGSATGTSWQVTALTGSVAPGQHYLVQEGAGAGGTTPLPTPDASGSIAMSATAGKVALVNSTTALTSCTSTGIVDFIGYGSTANCSELVPAPGLSNTAAALRADDGCVDTDNNGSDFTAGSPSPQNTASTPHLCDASALVGAGAATPGTTTAGGSTTLTVAVTPGVNPASTGISVACNLTAIGGSATQQLFDDGTNGDASSADDTFTFASTVGAGTPPGNKSLPCSIGDEQGRTGTAAIALVIAAPPVAIHAIQGAAHISPLAGQVVSTNGVVTATTTNGFWMQDPSPDADAATSEGLFVFTSSAPTVAAGDAVQVQGAVSEFRPGGNASTNANLTITELDSPTITTVSTGNPLPAATVVGTGGRIPPGAVIEDDATGDVETGGVFDPATDGLDFWESLEGMRVQLNDAVAVGPTNAFGETPVVGDDGANASVRTSRGGLLARPDDFNPERIILDNRIVGPLPAVNVGDHYPGAIVGVVDYNFGLYDLELDGIPTVEHDGVQPETTDAQGTNELAVATFNVENLAPTDPPAKFDRLADLVVTNLESPDVICVEEVQDDSGALDNGVVAADQTVAQLIAAIAAHGGPTYDWRAIDPVDDQDGGQPGGNIRQVFLFNPDRVAFVDRPGGTSLDGTTVTGSGASTQLTFSPGRIDPTNSAWTSSRKPLAGEFMFHGKHLFVIANHFNSKGGDNPLEGRYQPPVRSSETQRHQQAQLVHDFVAEILAADPTANVVVAGDLNDFEFSDTVSILKAGVLHDLIETLPQPERYSYVFEGNSQTLDHILLSGSLFERPFAYDVVHVNAEFADQASDHDPSVARLTLNEPPTVDAGGPYSVSAGYTVQVSATGSDPDGDAITYAWDLDDNGSFETPGQSVTFSAAGISTPGPRTITVQATDTGGARAVDSATVNVVVTYDSLCRLTRDLVTKADVADGLCEQLAAAKTFAAQGKTAQHDKKLQDYRNQLDRQVGKAVSAANAALLKALSLAL